MSSSRQWLTSGLRQCMRLQQQQCAKLSTTSAAAAFNQTTTSTPSNSNPSASLSGLDGESSGGGKTYNNLHSLMQESKQYAMGGSGLMSISRRASTMEEMKAKSVMESYMRMAQRKWKAGDVYAPKDLRPAEMKKWGTRRATKKPQDIVDVAGFNPVDNYRNFALVSDFISPMGKILHSRDTHLRPVNQRKVAKMVRRAIGMGIHPSVHKHPNIIGKGGNDALTSVFTTMS